MVNEIIINVKEEYPTYDWILEGMFKSSGLKIIKKQVYNELLTAYVLEK